jgi:hypothetical protein
MNIIRGVRFEQPGRWLDVRDSGFRDCYAWAFGASAGLHNLDRRSLRLGGLRNRWCGAASRGHFFFLVFEGARLAPAWPPGDQFPGQALSRSCPAVLRYCSGGG